MPTLGFDVILCPVDFSEISANALRYAAQLATWGKGRVVAAYASSFETPPYFTKSMMEDLQRQFREAARDAKHSLTSFVKSTLGEAAGAVEIRVVDGSPGNAIQKMAADVHAGLIVIGTHGRTGVNLWMLGSVAERVLRQSAVPVLTVRTSPRGVMKHILAPVNDTDLSRHVLSVAVRFASCFDATVTALHVQEAHGDAPVVNLCEWIEPEDRSRCSIRELVRHGDPAEEIVAVASETACDLLVIGAPQRRFFEGTVLSRTALRVVRHAPCPVLSISGGWAI
jgi:nucleotide-binding universal stress UspA family protein